ncbi:MAG: glycosyl hydrolase [Methanotrichaceae archaeon]
MKNGCFGPLLGVYLPEPSELPAFEHLIGKKVDTFLCYQSISEDFDIVELEPITAGGRIVQLAWEPHDTSVPDAVNQPKYRLRNIAEGKFDSDIRRWADQIRDFKHIVLFRPISEMNGDWDSWDGTVNGNVPADFIPAWRHLHDLFAEQGATNVKWVWSPSNDDTNKSAATTWSTYYPGDEYVDYIGIDGYNWGTSQDWKSKWQTFEQVFAPSYDVFASKSTKPLMICEFSSAEQGGSKAAWITNTFQVLQSRFPRLIAITWFNKNYAKVDFRVESSPQSIQAFHDSVAPNVCGSNMLNVLSK